MFRKWCQQENLMNSRNLSHVLMDGGVLSVPFDKLDDFYKVYRKCVDAGEPVFVVEQKTELYNFFLDIDYKDDEALDLNQIESICKVICNKVNSMGGKDCIISVARPRTKGGLIKTGVHMNWPGLVVDQEGAINLMTHVVNTLSMVYASKEWSKIIDDSVYGNPDRNTKGSGFRMPWSHKRSKHEECRGQGCTVCETTGKITEGPYLPMFKYTGESGAGPFKTPGVLSRIEPDISVDMLKMVTVRCETSETPASIPETKMAKKEGSFTKAMTKDCFDSPEASALLETHIRLTLRGQADVRLKKIFKGKESYYVETTSMFCENIGRDHSSNHVWFLVTPSGVCQKCFCRCETMKGRRFGLCKDFSGRVSALPPKLLNLMFPSKKQKVDNIKKNIRPSCSF